MKGGFYEKTHKPSFLFLSLRASLFFRGRTGVGKIMMATLNNLLFSSPRSANYRHFSIVQSLSNQMKCKISRWGKWLCGDYQRENHILFPCLYPPIETELNFFFFWLCVIYFTKTLAHLPDQPKDGNYDDGKLIIVTDSQILAIPLHRCNSEKINSCRYGPLPLNYGSRFSNGSRQS